MDLIKITDLDMTGKKVIVRADLDVGESLEEGDEAKLLTNKKTIDYLIEKKAKVILIGHRGRPEGKFDEKLSLREVSRKLSGLLKIEIDFVDGLLGEKVKDSITNLKEGHIICLENLRFDPGEEANDESFSERLSNFSDIYINDAFSSSAKPHASIVGLPKMLPHALGFRFLEEIENLSKVLENPKRPVVVIISGVKEDKLDYIEPFSKLADKILVAGRLPEFIDVRETGHTELNPEFREKILKLVNENKVIVADLIQDKEDITLRSVERFEEVIASSGTIVVGGPVGRYEDEGHRLGTKRVFEAVANSEAFKVAGGGDTEQAINTLGLESKFDWVSVGGGASLDFLAKGTLPGIEALKV